MPPTQDWRRAVWKRQLRHIKVQVEGLFEKKYLKLLETATLNYVQSFDHHYYYTQWGNMSSRFSSNSEEFASDFLENRKEMFPWFHMGSDFLSRF